MQRQDTTGGVLLHRGATGVVRQGIVCSSDLTEAASFVRVSWLMATLLTISAKLAAVNVVWVQGQDRSSLLSKQQSNYEGLVLFHGNSSSCPHGQTFYPSSKPENHHIQANNV